jgi:hypothetical protein
MGSERDSEIMALRVGRNFFGLSFSYVTSKRLLNISDTIGKVGGPALGNHLDRAVRTVAYPAAQVVPAGHAVSSKPETDPLDSAGKYYMLGSLVHSSSCVSQSAYIRSTEQKTAMPIY